MDLARSLLKQVDVAGPVGRVAAVADPRIEIGDVYRWSNDDRPVRVLLHDADIVMYDSWWPDLGNWGMADLPTVRRKQFHYYVTLADTLLTKASYVRSAPLSEEERALHRPDLPYAAAQRAGVTWKELGDGAAMYERAVLAAAHLYLTSVIHERRSTWRMIFVIDVC